MIVCACMRMCVHACVHACMCVYTHMCACMHACVCVRERIFLKINNEGNEISTILFYIQPSGKKQQQTTS